MAYPQRQSGSRRVIGPWMIALITIASIDSIRNLPIMAEYGLAIITMLLAGACLFFIPLVLVSTELSTAWPKRGGVYIWVAKAFGDGPAFVATWLQWVHNLPWYPVMLTYITATFIYAIDPAMAHSKAFELTTVLLLLWGMTAINFLGMHISGWVSALGALIGTLIPGTLIILLGAYWWASGHPIGFHHSADHWVPHLDMKNFVFFSGVVFGFAGIELSATHAQEVKNPMKSYPMGYLFAVVVVLVTSSLGALAIAAITPHSQLNIVTGIMSTFTLVFNHFHLGWLLLPLALAICLGAAASVSTWMFGSVKALLVIAGKGHLPKSLAKTNKHHAPVRLLVIQSIITTVLCVAFIVMPTVQSAFWALSVLAIQLYVLMYMMLFASAIRLRFTRADKERPFKVPGGKVGMVIVGSLGILCCGFVFIIGFIPPVNMHALSTRTFDEFLIIATLALTVIPLVLYHFYKPSWHHAHESGTQI